MARCFWMRRFSLGETYQRLRRTSLRIRSCMTVFLKRLSRASCDSPSRSVTVANVFTPFPSSNPAQRTCTSDPKNRLARPRPVGWQPDEHNSNCDACSPDPANGVDTAHERRPTGKSVVYIVSIPSTGTTADPRCLPVCIRSSPNVDTRTIIPDSCSGVKGGLSFCYARYPPRYRRPVIR
jgi:hypothetical protein